MHDNSNPIAEMMDERYFASSTPENVSLITTEDNTITSNDYFNFEKYDPYIEKIRSLFVPSLEPRIYNCLETLVYRKDTEQLSQYPRLKRCLEMAATFRQPVDDAFRTNRGDEGFLENILSHAIKYLIKDGLIDCFLNSIILNNRLNKVCRDLDALGIERDLLRYLAVWNYINDRDYWMENDQRFSMSASHNSHDSIDRHSDLDVEIGSKFRNYHNDKVSKKTLKRRATKLSSEDLQKSDDFSKMFHNNEGSTSHLQSWLSQDSCNLEQSKFNEEKRKSLISQTFPCRPSNCRFYRSKNSRQNDWEGKNLKLKISTASSIDSKYEPSKSLESSKLRLPCKYEDLIAKIIKADATLPGLFSISRSKKFQSSIINICRRINDILGRIDKTEVRRCTLNCEIFPGHLSLRMTQREFNGCKVCLLIDRVVVINKIEAKSENASAGSSVCQLPQITENENSRESVLTIYESARLNLNDDSTERISRSKLNVLPVVNNYDDSLESKNPNTSKQLNLEDHSLNNSNENAIENQSCQCEDSLDHVFVNFDHEQNNEENASKELARDICVVASDVYKLKDLTCNTSFDDTSHHFDDKPENNREMVNADKIKTEQGNMEDMTGKEPLFHSTLNDVDNQSCLWNDSFDVAIDPLDRTMEKKSEELSKESLIHPINDTFDNQTCLSSTTLENQPPDHLDHEAKTIMKQDNCVECLCKSIEDIFVSNHQDSKDSCFDQNVEKLQDHKTEDSSDLMLKRTSADSLEIMKLQPELTLSKPLMNAPEDERKDEILHCEIACACPSDCLCAKKDIPHDPSAECDSQCSCDSCHDPEPKKSLNTQINETCHRDDSNEISIKSNEDPINASSQKKNLKIDKVQNDQSKKSLLVLKSVATKIFSRSYEERRMETPKSHQKIVQSSQTNESREKLSHKSPAIISARLSKSKGQRINISIELCPRSESSMEKIRKNDSKNISMFRNDWKNIENFGYTEPKVLPLLRKSRCHSVDPDNAETRINQLSEKNTKDKCLGDTNDRVHSPLRPLEFRDYLPPLERPSSLRNPNLYGNPIKSRLRSNGKYESRSMIQEKRTPKNYETREFCRSIRNKRCCEKNNPEHMLFNENKGSSRYSRNSQKFSSSVINGPLCHAFSSGSVDRMRHLIKTKLRRILLERDKSTNTPKTILTNKKYRVSVPNGKMENSAFNRRQCCRTIWESHSASGSTRTGSSFIPEDRTRIRDRDEMITHLLYSSARRSKSYLSSFEAVTGNLNYSKNNSSPIVSARNVNIVGKSDPSELNSMKNSTRLAGGSDFIPSKKALESDDVLFSKKEQHPQLSSIEKKNQPNSGRKDKKLCGKSINCNFHEIFENTSPRLNREDWTSEVTGKKFIALSGKLDSSLNSTSRHIYLYEFGEFETSNDELVESRNKKRDCDSLKKVYTSKICKEQANKRDLTRKKKLREKKARECSNFRQVKIIPKSGDVSRGTDETKNSLSNTNTMNSRQNTMNSRFAYLDHDLRSKLAQYVNICKSVKYSLLKRLRPDDFCELRGTSVSCGDRYKFGDS